jgi:hypothetical protein
MLLEVMVLVIFISLIKIVVLGCGLLSLAVVYLLMGVIEGVLGLVILIMLARGSGDSYVNLSLIG